MLARIHADEPSVRAGAVRAASRIPSVREQFEATYEAYARLLRDRGPWKAHLRH
jgi:hypothetical protein